jgi:hypothetical protein
LTTLISELIFGTRASWKDPLKYKFAHGGKDGILFLYNLIIPLSQGFLLEYYSQTIQTS